jgi:DNA (cytosine-5)-methyltransferase 1
MRLGELGYSTWTGTLTSECYGVPQTRERAFLLASLDGAVKLPEPTHQRYVPGVDAGATHEIGLFGEIITEPWVSMGEALPSVVDRLLSTGRDWKPGGTREDAQTIPTSRPAPTVTSVESQWQWIHERPATVVMGDRRIFNPGHHANADYPATGSRNDGAVRVTVPEQLVLQGFRSDYPVQGKITSRYQQVGNAVPPPLAAAVVGALAL